MSCKSPLKGFIIGINPETGKRRLKITPYDVAFLEEINGKYYYRKSTDHVDRTFNNLYTEFVDIPCGRCIGCRLDHSKQFADRGALELSYHNSNYFLTITYSDGFVPTVDSTSLEGYPIQYYNLVKEDLQLFWKNLRQHLITRYKQYCMKNNLTIKKENYPKIRYIACGEYGEKTLRCHFHAIVYGLVLNDLVYYGKSKSGEDMFTSKFIDDIWKKGEVWISEACWNNIAYITRYTTKKLYGEDSKYYEELGITPPFITMSRKPGIGRDYYEDNKQRLFEEQRFYIPTRDGVRAGSPSRYYFGLFENDFDPLLVEEKKNDLKASFEASKVSKLQDTSLNYIDYLKTEEYNLKQNTKSLKRDGI